MGSSYGFTIVSSDCQLVSGKPGGDSYRIAGKFYEAKSQKFIHEFTHLLNFLHKIHCKTGFACVHGPVEVFSVQSRFLPDLKCCLSSTGRPQAIDSANKKVPAILAPDSSSKDRPSRGPYMKLSPEQTAQVAIYAMESRNRRAISRLSSSRASISRKVQSGGGNMRKYRESDWHCQYKMLPNRKQGRPLLFVEELDNGSHPPLQKRETSKHKRKLSIYKSQNLTRIMLVFQRNRKIFFREIFLLYGIQSAPPSSSFEVLICEVCG